VSRYKAVDDAAWMCTRRYTSRLGAPSPPRRSSLIRRPVTRRTGALKRLLARRRARPAPRQAGDAVDGHR
jgi:hypothetical protein